MRDVLFEVRGSVGLITLNRPHALNALTLGMIRAIAPRLSAWSADSDVRTVVIQGAGERAFCAGGDVRAVYEAGLAARSGGDGALTRDFFREEYTLNRGIHRFPKPYVALLDGITMGGGAGLSVHGSHRIVTERTLFAMPETGIGFFPDIGASHFLPRCPGEIGLFAALVGARLGPADTLCAGLGTAYVPSAAIDELVGALAATDLTGDAHAAVDAVIARFAASAGPAPLAAAREAVDRCFAAERIEGILAALNELGTPWAAQTLSDLRKMSPTSLKVTLRQLRHGKNADFDEAMRLEYRLSQAFMHGPDFYEGIRSVLVDKDRKPRWHPSSIAAVTDADVERHFAALDGGELVFAD